MGGKRGGLGLLVIVSNAAIVAGAVAFEWNALTVAALFIADGLLGLIRISLERAFARQPVPDKHYPPTTPYSPNEWFRLLLDKRGSIRITDRLPPITVRYLQYTISLWILIVIVGGLLALGWYSFEPASSIALSFVTVIPLFVAKHASIVAVWTDNGVYEHSSPITVRRRSVLYSSVLFSIVVLYIVSQPPEYVVSAVGLMLGPKLLFDFREAGIGPRPLTFDPSSDTKWNDISAPSGTPRYVFQTDDRALFSWACIYIGIPYVVHPGVFVLLLVSTLLWPLVGFLSGTILLALLPTTGLILAVTCLLMWVAHANVEYRLYDDTLVAYDRYLEEPQWVVPFDDIESIETDDKTLLLARLLPSATSELTIVELECTTGEDRRIEFLAQPDDFVRIVRGRVRGRSASV